MYEKSQFRQRPFVLHFNFPALRQSGEFVVAIPSTAFRTSALPGESKVVTVTTGSSQFLQRPFRTSAFQSHYLGNSHMSPRSQFLQRPFVLLRCPFRFNRCSARSRNSFNGLRTSAPDNAQLHVHPRSLRVAIPSTAFRTSAWTIFQANEATLESQFLQRAFRTSAARAATCSIHVNYPRIPGDPVVGACIDRIPPPHRAKRPCVSSCGWSDLGATRG